MASRSNSSTRLVDYYFEVTVTSSATEGFIPLISKKIPPQQHDNFHLPDGVPYFCIPGSIEVCERATFERIPSFFIFSLTCGDGRRAYGFSLLYYYQLPEDKQSSVWRPKVICVVSHYPYFSFFKSFICWIYKSLQTCHNRSLTSSKISRACLRQKWLLSPQKRRRENFEPNFKSSLKFSNESVNYSNFNIDEEAQLLNRIINDFVMTVPLPKLGWSLDVTVLNRYKFRFEGDGRKGIPYVDDYFFQILFRCLSLPTVIYVINCMILEQRILVHSTHYGLLTPVCEALCALMFPFTWEHVYIPVLPIKLVDYLQAPVPFLMGVHTSCLATRTGSEVFASCVVVHLDKDKVITPIHSRLDRTPSQEKIVEFPVQLHEQLLDRIDKVVPSPVYNQPTCAPMKKERPSRRNAATSNTSRQLSRVSSISSAISNSPSSFSEVEVTFGAGPLGITFESTNLRLLAADNFDQSFLYKDASAVVKSFPRIQHGVPGPAELSGVITVGSYLIGINGQSTLSLGFCETIERLRCEPRPMVLRFQNASLPYENACRFADRLKDLSILSVLNTSPETSSIGLLNSQGKDEKDESHLASWVNKARCAFLELFISLLHDFQRFVCVEHKGDSPRSCSSNSLEDHLDAEPAFLRRNSLEREYMIVVSFDSESFISHCPNNWAPFLRELIATQGFISFINDSALGRMDHIHHRTSERFDLFTEAVHLFHDFKTSDRNCSPKKSFLQVLCNFLKRPHPVPLTKLIHWSLPEKVVEHIDLKEEKCSIELNRWPMEKKKKRMTRKRANTVQLEMTICGSSSSSLFKAQEVRGRELMNMSGATRKIFRSASDSNLIISMQRSYDKNQSQNDQNNLHSSSPQKERKMEVMKQRRSVSNFKAFLHPEIEEERAC